MARLGLSTFGFIPNWKSKEQIVKEKAPGGLRKGDIWLPTLSQQQKKKKSICTKFQLVSVDMKSDKESNRISCIILETKQ